MLRDHRSLARAVCLIPALLIVVGCAGRPALQTAATQTPAAVAPLAAPTTRPAATDTPTPTRASPTAAPVSTLAASPRSGQATAAVQGSIEPRFGPAWGDRSAFGSGLIASERKALSAGMPGASEYRIDLRIDDTMTGISGEQQVRYVNRENAPLKEIYLRLFPNALGGEMRVSDVTVDGLRVTPEYRYEKTAIRVPLAAPLLVGQSTVLSLKYTIEVPTSMDKGYGLISYSDEILALDTPYLPIPVYNEEGWNVEAPPPNADTSFNDPSFYWVRITAPASLELVVTGVEVAREAAGDSQVVTYAQGPARDFFVAASSAYRVSTQQAGETRVNSYALPGQERGQAIALDAAVNALSDYNRRFGPYPYTELDVAATPMLALGIEYPGAVGISERIYRSDYEPSSGSAEVLLESTVAHELAHQWFYNLVGSDQIDQPWLDEALAQYSTWLYFVDRYGATAGDALVQNWNSRWDRMDREKKPVGLPAREYSEREYSSIVYGRGPLFLAALAERMGQPAFDRFLKDYSTRFRWGIATTADFEALASQACGCDLSDLYREWLEP